MATHEGVLQMAEESDLSKGIELIPNKAYLFGRDHIADDKEDAELIVLVENGIKVGAIYRMGTYDIHWVMKPEYRGRHILSNFLRTGILNRLWSGNKAIDCESNSIKEFDLKKHLADLCNISIKDEDKHRQSLIALEQEWEDASGTKWAIDHFYKDNIPDYRLR